MAIYGYTKNYKLIKPQFNTDTWHDYIYDNLDTIDAVMSAIYASGNWKGFWAKNMTYVTGDVIIDQDTDTMYKVMIDHVTSADTFAAEQTAHPDYYELWSPNNLAESWAVKTDGKVSNTDYSAKAYAISSGLISEGSAKEWAVGSGAIGNTNEYSAKKYATDTHNDYISLTTNVNVVAVGSNIANVNAVGQSISNVNTVASNVSSVNTVAGVSTDVTTVAGIASSVPTVANNSANVTTVATNISDVNTAATNIEAIKDATNQANAASQSASAASQSATNSANSATASANSATASATSANNSHIWAEGTDAQVQALGGVHSSKGWAEQSTNANIALTNSPYTTNRILEIPQDIKLELNNGTLTLKAGSKVYVPNGFEADGTTPKFDVVTIANDVVSNAATTTTGTSLFFLYSNLSIGAFTAPDDAKVNYYFSGNTAPTVTLTYALWYDTANNIVKNTFDNGATWGSGNTLPIAICSYTNGTGVTSIDQVFNGFGYIGSTVFALPGVRGLNGKGKQTDGTFLTEIREVKSVLTTTVTAVSDRLIGLFLYPVGEDKYGLGNANSWELRFSYEENCMYSGPTKFFGLKAGEVYYETTPKLSLFRPVSVDSVVNSNASNFSQAGRSYLSGLGMPSGRYIDLTLGASGSTYTAPANGYFVVTATSTSASRALVIFEKSHGICNGDHSYSADTGLRCFVPCQKGKSTSLIYGGATITGLRFVYAEGEN